MERTDEALLQDFNTNRCEEAFRVLTLRYAPLVYGACLRYLRNQELAEDAAQAVFLIFARQADRLRVKSTLVPWYLSTSRRVCRDVLRSEKRRQRHEVPIHDDIASSEAAGDIALFEALERLHDSEREAVILRFAQRLSFAEVGQIQGVSEDAARMRVQRGLKRLRRSFVPILVPPPTLLNILGHLERTSPRAKLFSTLPQATLPVAPLALCGSVGGLALAIVAVHGRSAQLTIQAKTDPTVASRQSSPEAIARLMSVTTDTLDRSFTLVYDFSSKNLRSQSAIDAVVALEKRHEDPQVEADTLTPEKEKRQLRDFRANLTRSVHGRLTISFDGSALLATYVAEDGGNPPRIATILRGGYEYAIVRDPNFRTEGISPEWYAVMGLPLVGPSLPYFPLRRQEKVLCVDLGERPPDEVKNRLPYVKGTVSANTDGAISKIDISPFEKYALSKHRLFEEKWLAGEIRKTDGNRNSRYLLVSATTTPLPAEQFEPGFFLKPGDTFRFEKPGGQSASLKYQPSLGTLEQQIESVSGGALE